MFNDQCSMKYTFPSQNFVLIIKIHIFAKQIVSVILSFFRSGAVAMLRRQGNGAAVLKVYLIDSQGITQ